MENCQKVFFEELKKYFGEITDIKEKSTNSDTQTQAQTQAQTQETKSKTKKLQITNLERLQNGSMNVNIIRTICSRITDNKLDFIEKLITNRQMNFTDVLVNYTAKYNLMTTYKSSKVILLHSPYIHV